MNECYRRIRYLMGSFFEVTAYGEKESCAKGVIAAFTEIARVERLLSVYRPQSDLARLNAYRKGGTLSVDPELFEVLAQSILYSEKSGWAFDPTAAPLIRLWGFGPGGERSIPPEKEEIAALLDRIGFQHVRLASGQIELLKEGMEINLGGIGKGYAIDRAVEKLREQGITQAMISCGSTIYALGAPPDQKGWRIDLQHPRREEGRIGTVYLCNQALSTSGDYEKYFIFEGRRFSHLIDPRTGCPAEGIAGVSVIASTAMEADALSTAVFVLGKPAGQVFLKRFPGAEGLIVEEERDKELSFHRTEGWERSPAGPSFSRRRFLALASMAMIALFLPIQAEAAVVYLTEEEALRKMMPEADRFDPHPVDLSADQLAEAQKLAGRAFREDDYRFWVGRKGEEAVGYAALLEVVGKERPITFLIGIRPDGEIRGVEVLVYRESRGSEIRNPRFMAQFVKKKIDNPLRLGDDVESISGATLSSRAATYAVRKALAIFEVVFKKRADRHEAVGSPFH
ncbi:MAG: FMN-binding protein [Candidatus Manganitrophaceae bacterium]|nr:MAG: FMN-binding protein [Candidatus Manganitrophaceae bacterium]